MPSTTSNGTNMISSQKIWSGLEDAKENENHPGTGNSNPTSNNATAGSGSKIQLGNLDVNNMANMWRSNGNANPQPGVPWSTHTDMNIPARLHHPGNNGARFPNSSSDSGNVNSDNVRGIMMNGKKSMSDLEKAMAGLNMVKREEGSEENRSGGNGINGIKQEIDDENGILSRKLGQSPSVSPPHHDEIVKKESNNEFGNEFPTSHNLITYFRLQG